MPAQSAPAKGAAPTPAEGNQLVALFNAGRHAELEGRAHLLVKQYPDSGFAWKVLGIALSVQGKDALAALQKAAEFLPDDAEAHSNLGNALHDHGKIDEAVASCRRALAIKSDYAKAHSNLGNALRELGQLDDAVASYRRALAIEPDYAEAHSNLGNALRDLGQLDDAVANYRRALAIRPDYVETNSNLGAVLRELGQLDDAVASCRRALALKPDYVEAHCNLGNALQDLGQLDDAVASFRRALEIKPDYAKAHFNLGNALRDLGQLNGAVASYRRALEIEPDYAEVYVNLGNALKDQCLLDEAAASYRRALEIEPRSAEAYNNLGNILMNLGRSEEALTSYRRALEVMPDFAMAYSNLLYAFNFQPAERGADILALCREYDERFCLPHRGEWQGYGNSRDANRRLRIGYVSPDFRRHAVAYFAEPIFANHDKAQVEIFCYAQVMREDEYTGRFRQLADHWHSIVGMSDDAVAKMIRDHQIDILVDLAGHTADNRLLVFARKPAPVQITYLGYPGTTGLSAMDYRITDHYADPEGTADARYTERLLRLPGSLWCYRPSADMPEVSPLPALERGYLTFGSFNNFNKIDQLTLELWAVLLRTLPASRLMMLTVPEGETRLHLANRFVELGIDAQRLEFHGKLSSAEFHRKFLEVDITLDPVTVNGATTTCESLWMGVPVISLAGTRFLTRAGLSILSTAGFTDFAVASPEGYVRLAAHLADNLPLLAEIRSNMRAHVASTPLIDEAGFTRNLELLYREAWKRWCGNTDPRPAA